MNEVCFWHWPTMLMETVSITAIVLPTTHRTPHHWYRLYSKISGFNARAYPSTKNQDNAPSLPLKGNLFDWQVLRRSTKYRHMGGTVGSKSSNTGYTYACNLKRLVLKVLETSTACNVTLIADTIIGIGSKAAKIGQEFLSWDIIVSLEGTARFAGLPFQSFLLNNLCRSHNLLSNYQSDRSKYRLMYLETQHGMSECLPSLMGADWKLIWEMNRTFLYEQISQVLSLGVNKESGFEGSSSGKIQ